MNALHDQLSNALNQMNFPMLSLYVFEWLVLTLFGLTLLLSLLNLFKSTKTKTDNNPSNNNSYVPLESTSHWPLLQKQYDEEELEYVKSLYKELQYEFNYNLYTSDEFKILEAIYYQVLAWKCRIGIKNADIVLAENINSPLNSQKCRESKELFAKAHKLSSDKFHEIIDDLTKEFNDRT